MHSIAGFLTPLNVLICLAVLAVVVGRLLMFLRVADRARMLPGAWTGRFYHKTSEKTSR